MESGVRDLHFHVERFQTSQDSLVHFHFYDSDMIPFLIPTVKNTKMDPEVENQISTWNHGRIGKWFLQV